MQEIPWSDFEKVELQVGRVVSAERFSEARNPAYVLHVDFGEAIGVRKSSAQITALYSPEELVGRQVLAVVTPEKADRPADVRVSGHWLSRQGRQRRAVRS